MANEAATTLREVVPFMYVEDLDASVRYYCNLLGFEITQKWEPDGKLAWCRLEHGQAAIMLQQAEAEDGPAEGRGRGLTLFFICDDVDAVRTGLIARGLSLDPPEVTFFGWKQQYLRDPDGYSLCFESPVK
jgi:lactoylglutathione lyase